MSKIYSRPRINIKIPKILISRHKKPKRPSKNKKKMLRTLIITIIAFSTVKIVLDAILPIFDTLCKDKAKSIATIISNEQATIVTNEHKYDELFTVEKDNEGNVTVIKTNINPINDITSDVAIKIQEELEKKGKDNVKIAMRKLYRKQVISRKRTRNTNNNIMYRKHSS